MAATGPTLLDLQMITGSTTDQIAYVVTARAIGGFIGGAATSAIVTFFNNWYVDKASSFTRNVIQRHILRVPTRTGKPGKMGRHFPVREKSGNFDQTGKVREKSHKILEN